MTLPEVENVFSAVLPDATFHYHADSKLDQYAVWAEDGQADASYADNHMDEMVLEGTIDYYTRIEDDPLVKEFQKAMNKADMSWGLNSIQYEEKTGYIHYEWVWQVGDTVG